MPEREVDPALATRLVESQFPDLRPARVEFLAAGWDNTVFSVGGAWVFRFPRRAIAVPLLEREVRLLPALVSSVTLPIPVPTRVGHSSGSYPWPFAGYRLLPGAPASERLEEEELAEPAGRFLRALHAFPVADAVALGAGADELGRTDVAKRSAKARAALTELAQAGVVDRALALRRLDEWTAAPFASRPRVLCHGDFWAKNLLVDDAGRLTAVIDWGDVHVGDPACDLGFALTLSSRRRFEDGYGQIDDQTVRLARIRALDHTLAIARQAVFAHDQPLLLYTRAALANVLAS